ncbi:MAG: sensor histidine kinase [Betaproteobacteria bacterium]|nr:MAG: sensor histidine kinase [Betaproteobacteria bacterium]
MLPQSLRFRVGFYVALALMATLLLFALLVVRQQRAALLGAAEDHVTQMSEAIVRSTRFAMLQNQPEFVHRIIQDVARAANIDRVRIFSKEGVIIDSTYTNELGLKVDRSAEGCFMCHRSERPTVSLPSSGRARIFEAADGRRMLASMEVIRNEPSCYNAACHVHKQSQSVLGVLDIVYSLDAIDRSMQAAVTAILVLSLGFVMLVALAVGVFVHRLIYRPLRDLEAGAQRIAQGNLEKPIPVRSDDEFGRLAGSFNGMTQALRASQRELQRWNETLERKVEARTQALRVAEAEAVRGEKLASVGLLAAGIAHELNNPLTGILTFTSLMRKNLPDGSTEAEDLDLVIKETRRCAAIIRRLLDFAREKAPEKRFADLNRLIEGTVHIVAQPAQLQDIEIRLELDPALPQVWVDTNMIEQVVMNMLVNAQHAIGQKGRITIRTRRAPEPKSPAVGAAAVPMAEISIADTGCGIPEKNLKRIFDPFFTSKEVGKGTGLGLSVSHGIVEAHGGLIEVESRVGEGTTFRVYLPLAPADAQPAHASEGSR